jgi:hypothetical protein
MKFLHRRRFLHLATGAAVLPVVSYAARAQAYPSRPVRNDTAALSDVFKDFVQ